MKKLLFTLLLFLLPWTASAQETLPPYHWANDYIDYFQVRGLLPGLSILNRPWSRQDIARELLRVGRADLKTATRRQMFRVLFREFAPELQRLPEGDIKMDDLLREGLEFLQIELLPQTVSPRIKAGIFGEGIVLNRGGDDAVQNGTELEIDLHPNGGVFWQDRWTLYNNTRIFSNPPANYVGKEFSDLYAYTEQGYLAYNGGWMSAKIGRDYMQIGPGRSGQLLMSDNSRPYDLYHLQLGKGFFRYQLWGFQLDEFPVIDTLTQEPVPTNRYLNGHRISLHFNRKFQVGLSEVVIYGGPTRGWDLRFMNPFGFYYAHNVNMSSNQNFGNIFYSLDWDFSPRPNINLYGEFLLDDVQLEKEVPQDLEPSEFGIVLGVNYADPGGLDGILLNIEYAQVRNRTYNARDNAWEKYLHRFEEIGHRLGNDFYAVDTRVTWWPLPQLQIGAFFSLIRQGEGTVEGEFNTDYLNFTVDEGYEEDFPFGVVEKQNLWGISGFYKPHSLGHITFDLTMRSFDNHLHVDGAGFSDTEMTVKLWLEWQKIWSR